jgi:hypothetical protein
MPNLPFTKKWIVGDTRTAITDKLVDAAGDPVSIPDGTIVRFRMVNKETDAVKIDNDLGVIEDAATGLVSYTFNTSDVDTAGDYWYWWILESQTGREEHFPGDGEKATLSLVEIP